MFQQKSTETVTLTRAQLQAILEVITQIGGITHSEARNEPKVNHTNNNKITYKETQNQHTSDNQLFNRNNNYWEHEREDMLERDDWYSLKNDKEQYNIDSYAPLMLNNNQFSNRILSPTVTNSSKADDSRVNSVMTNTSNESNFRRYARINDCEFDLNALQQKRIKASEYSRALDKQNEERQRKKREDSERMRIQDQLLEKRAKEQRIRLNSDYETEQKQIQEKRAIAERKREAVIAAIEKTPVIKKRNFLVEKESEEANSPQQQQQQPVVTVATIRPQARTKETFVQTDRECFFPQKCDTATQTDVQLLLHLLKEMSFSSKGKEKTNSDPTETISSASTSSMTPKIHRKSSDSQKSNSLSNRPVWGTNQSTKSNVKNTEKYPIQKLQEMRKKFKEKEIQSRNENKDNNEDKDNSIKLKNKQKLSEDTQPQLISRSLRRSSLTLSAKNISEFNNQKRMSVDHKTKLHFLPQISARPHSRKKWYSQETFNPSFLA